MLRHVVLFRWTDDATDEQKQAVVDALAALPGSIPDLRAYRFGPDFGLVEGNFDFAVTADVDDAEAFVRYRDHPVHQQVIAERIRPILATRVAVQFEVPASGDR